MNDSEKAFHALGDATRRLIFEKLRERPMAVSEISEGLPVSRPAVSQHLKILKEAKLVRINQKGTRNICQIDQDGVIAMRFYLDQFWDEALANFKSIAEKEENKNQ